MRKYLRDIPRPTLLANFSITSLAALVVIGVLLGIGLTRHFEQQALDQQKAEAASMLPPVVGPFITEELLRDGAHGEEYEEIEDALSHLGGSGLVRINIWNRDGVLVYSDEPLAVGQRLLLTSPRKEALDGIAGTEVSLPASPDKIEERGYGEFVVVYTPLLMPGKTGVYGVIEGYYAVDDLREHIEYTTGYLWSSIGIGFLSLYVALFTIVHNASLRLTRQSEENATLLGQVQQSNADLALAYDCTLEGWSRALDMRDKETEGHTQRVTEMTMQLARAMGIGGEELLHMRRGALLHDIGKMGIPDSILLKPGPLTDEEQAIMRLHPAYACQLLSQIEFLHPALDIPYCHHEKWDGTGYPRGLKGEEIPLAARIFAIADVWDALCSDRPYRKAWSKEAAYVYIQEQSGKHFDPQVVEVFVREMPVLTSFHSPSKSAVQAHPNGAAAPTQLATTNI